MAATRTARPGPPSVCDTKNAVTAPISIIPSTPRFRTPERSASSSPRPASTSGVPKRWPRPRRRRRDRRSWSHLGSGLVVQRRSGSRGPAEPDPVTTEELPAQHAEQDDALHGPDQADRERRPLQGEAGVGERTDQDRRRSRPPAGCTSPARRRRCPCSRSRPARAARVEHMPEVADLACAGDPGQCAGQGHHRDDRAPGAHPGVVGGGGRIAHDAHLESEPGPANSASRRTASTTPSTKPNGRVNEPEDDPGPVGGRRAGSCPAGRRARSTRSGRARRTCCRRSGST